MSAGHPALALAGRIESGKSSVASLLSERLGLPVFSFGAYIRSISPPDARREDLQAAGARLLEEVGPDGLVAAVLEFGGLDSATPAIWEGVRHLSVFEALRARYAPIAVDLFYLSPPEGPRLARARQSAGTSRRRAVWEAHQTEETDALAASARMKITANTPQAAAAEILSELG
jgi:hypothetical protein